MKDEGFINIGNWHLNDRGRLGIRYDPEISNVSGVIAIFVNNELMLFSATRRYGPRIGDFTHALRGDTQHARIHSKIVEALNVNKTVSLWVKHSTSPMIDKRALLRKHNPQWNL